VKLICNGSPIIGGAIGPTTLLGWALIPYQEVDFNPNSTLEKWLVR